MRKRIFQVIEPLSGTNIYANMYDFCMIFVILISFIPLVFREETGFLRWIDGITLGIFVIDYILRWITADYKFKKRGAGSFLRYPFSPMAIIDLLSILPIIAVFHPAFRLFRAVRLMRACRVLRIIRIFRYSENMKIIGNVFRKQKYAFLMVFFLMVGYIFVTAVLLFQVEPDTFDSFFDAVYWAVILLTTVGYGDVIAVTTMGKVITIISSVMGVAVVALPAGLITAGYLDELRQMREEKDRQEGRKNRLIREKDVDKSGPED